MSIRVGSNVTLDKTSPVYSGYLAALTADDLPPFPSVPRDLFISAMTHVSKNSKAKVRLPALSVRRGRGMGVADWLDTVGQVRFEDHSSAFHEDYEVRSRFLSFLVRKSGRSTYAMVCSDSSS